jgi:hypothetical protein
MSERTGNLDDHFGSVCFFATWILPIGAPRYLRFWPLPAQDIPTL